MEKNQLIERILSQSNYSHISFDEKIKIEVIYPSIEFLLQKLEIYPEFDFDKILLISLLLLNKIEKVEIRITLRILVLRKILETYLKESISPDLLVEKKI